MSPNPYPSLAFTGVWESAIPKARPTATAELLPVLSGAFCHVELCRGDPVLLNTDSASLEI